jgi:hypothetical protein
VTQIKFIQMLGDLVTNIGVRNFTDLFNKGQFTFTSEDEDSALEMALKYKKIGFQVRGHVYSASGHYASCIPDKYTVTVSFPGPELKEILFSEDNGLKDFFK